MILTVSIPSPLSGHCYNEIIQEASDAGVHTLLDADRGPLTEGAAAHPEIVKGNRREFERLVGRPLDDEDSTLGAACEVHERGVPTVLATRGRHGAIAVSRGNIWRGVAPRVRAVSAVGSGDAFTAGVVLTLSRGDPMEDALCLGIAAGTAAVLTPGTELCHRREVDILYPRVRVEPIADAVSSRN